MIAALPFHENRNCRNIRAELDGHGSAGADLVGHVILRGCVDLRIDDAGNNARRGVDPDPRQHGYAVGERRGRHRSVHHTRRSIDDTRRHSDDPGRNIHGDAGRVDIRAQGNGSATATTTNGQSGNGQSSASGSTGPIRPIPPNSQTSSGSGQTPGTRTGKNALNETVTDCMKLWEPATHMSKADWQRTCRRVQGRLDQVSKQVLGR